MTSVRQRESSSVEAPDVPEVARPRRTLEERARSNPLSTVITVSIDVVATVVGVAVGMWWTSVSEVQVPPALLSALYVPLAIAVLALRKTYRRKLNRRFLDEIGPVLAGQALAAMLLLSLLILLDVPGQLGRSVARLWICAAVLVLLCRAVRAVVQRSLRRHDHLVSPVLIVGNGRVAHRIIERLQSSPELGLSAVGLLDAEPPWFGSEAEDKAAEFPYLGAPSTIDEAIRQTGAEGVIIAFSRTQDQLLTSIVRIAHAHGLRVWVVPRCSTPSASTSRRPRRRPAAAACPTPTHGVAVHPGQALRRPARRRPRTAADLADLPGLMLLVRLSSPGPIFFRQHRVGRDGSSFDCLKFRSMRPPRASDAEFAAGGRARTRWRRGRRPPHRDRQDHAQTSLDELPQLLNVLKGDMSLVGPRPERPEFVELFEAQIRRYGERHRVKAGVTGWAQVHGLRGQTSIADRAEWDNYYIENWSSAPTSRSCRSPCWPC